MAVPDGVDADRGMRQVARDVGARHDHGGRPVARRVAVVEAERPADQAGGEVVLQAHRLAVDRGRVERGVLAPGERHGGELLARRAVLVHVAHGVARDPVGGRHRAERDQVGAEAADAARARADPESARARRGRRLADRAVHQHVTREPRGDGQRRRDDRSDLSRHLGPRDVPAHRESEGVLHVGDAGAGEARRAPRPWHRGRQRCRRRRRGPVRRRRWRAAPPRRSDPCRCGRAAARSPTARRRRGWRGARAAPRAPRVAAGAPRPRRCRCAWAGSRASCAGRSDRAAAHHPARRRATRSRP